MGWMGSRESFRDGGPEWLAGSASPATHTRTSATPAPIIQTKNDVVPGAGNPL